MANMALTSSSSGLLAKLIAASRNIEAPSSADSCDMPSMTLKNSEGWPAAEKYGSGEVLSATAHPAFSSSHEPGQRRRQSVGIAVQGVLKVVHAVNEAAG